MKIYFIIITLIGMKKYISLYPIICDNIEGNWIPSFFHVCEDGTLHTFDGDEIDINDITFRDEEKICKKVYEIFGEFIPEKYIDAQIRMIRRATSADEKTIYLSVIVFIDVNSFVKASPEGHLIPVSELDQVNWSRWNSSYGNVRLANSLGYRIMVDAKYLASIAKLVSEKHHINGPNWELVYY